MYWKWEKSKNEKNKKRNKKKKKKKISKVWKRKIKTCREMYTLYRYTHTLYLTHVFKHCLDSSLLLVPLLFLLLLKNINNSVLCICCSHFERAVKCTHTICLLLCKRRKAADAHNNNRKIQYLKWKWDEDAKLKYSVTVNDYEKKKPKFSRKMKLNKWNRITTASPQLLISIFTSVFKEFSFSSFDSYQSFQSTIFSTSTSTPHTSIFIYIYTYLVSIIYAIINWSYISTHSIFTQKHFRNSSHHQDSIQLSKLSHERKNEKKGNQLLCVHMSLLNVM